MCSFFRSADRSTTKEIDTCLLVQMLQSSFQGQGSNVDCDVLVRADLTSQYMTWEWHGLDGLIFTFFLCYGFG